MLRFALFFSMCPTSDDKYDTASDDKTYHFHGDSSSLLSELEPYAFTSITMKDFVFDYLRLRLVQMP